MPREKFCFWNIERENFMALKKTALKTLSGIAAIGLTLGIAAPASADEGGERRTCTRTTHITLQAVA